MKKIIISLLFCLLLTPLAAFSNNNFIYSINVSPDDTLSNGVRLEVKSDYKTKITNKIDELGREYFDIKDASLKENFVIQSLSFQAVDILGLRDFTICFPSPLHKTVIFSFINYHGTYTLSTWDTGGQSVMPIGNWAW